MNTPASGSHPEPVSRAPKPFLDGLEATALGAAAAVGGFRGTDLRLAGFGVRLEFAGPTLEALFTPALAHLASKSIGRAPLTVKLWDSRSTRSVMPPPPWGPDDYREHGKLRGYFGDGLYTMFQWGSHSLSVLDTRANRAFYWVRSAEQVGYFEIAAPLRTILHLWLRERGVQLVHASAVGSEAGVVLLVGPSGAGKSSAALACLTSDLKVLADDYCLLGPEAPPTVHSLYSSAKLHADALDRMPGLAGMVANPSRPPYEKALLFLNQHRPDKLLALAPLQGVVLVRVAGQPSSRIRPVSPAAALAALAPSTLLQLPGSSQPTLARLARVVRSVPCHELQAGGAPDGVARAIGSLLDG